MLHMWIQNNKTLQTETDSILFKKISLSDRSLKFEHDFDIYSNSFCDSLNIVYNDKQNKIEKNEFYK